MSCAIILCGGESRRMGRDKAFVEFRGKRLVDIVLGRLRPDFDRIIISAKQSHHFEYLGIPIALDDSNTGGALVGILSGLKAIRESHAFFCACDLPFVDARLAKYLLQCSTGVPPVGFPLPLGEGEGEGVATAPDMSAEKPAAIDAAFDVVIPRTPRGVEPLCAVYGKNCIGPIEEQVKRSDMKITRFFKHVRVCEVDVSKLPFPLDEDKAFFNINRPEELARPN